MNQSIPTHESQVTELKEQLANEKTNARSLDREKTYYYMKNIQLEAQLAKAEDQIRVLIKSHQKTRKLADSILGEFDNAMSQLQVSDLTLGRVSDTAGESHV